MFIIQSKSDIVSKVISVENVTELINEALDRNWKKYKNEIDEFETLSEKDKASTKLLFIFDKCKSLINTSNKISKLFSCPAPLIRGAIAEILATELFEAFLKIEGINGTVVNSSIIPVNNPNNPNLKTTQVDVVCVTDKCIFVCECKSLFGKLKTDGETILSPNIPNPIYPWKQNRAHILSLTKELEKLNIRQISYQNLVFLFSIGKFISYEQPEDINEHLLVPKGFLKNLKDIYKNLSSYKPIQPQEINTITNYLISKKPTIEQITEHIEALEKLFK